MLAFGSFSPAWNLWGVATATCAAALFFVAVRRFLRSHNHVLEIPGPVNNATWLYGNFPELLLTPPYGKFAFRWLEQYGSTYRFKGCFSKDLLFTSDPATVRYIFNNAKMFDFAPSERFLALMLLGKENLGALRSDGEVHRRVKNAFLPAFASARLQLYVPVIKDIALKAADKLMQSYLKKCEQNDSNMVIDVFRLMQHISSDVIGEVGFNHKFNAVETDGGDKVSQTHQGLVLLSAKRSKNAILGDGLVPYIPPIFLRAILYLPTRMFRVLFKFREVSQAWSQGLLKDYLEGENDPMGLGLVGFVASANKYKKQEQLSFDEICHQTSTFLVTGQETIAIAMLWALCELAKRPKWQDQIRKEIIEAQTVDSNLDKLEYLNAHIKETLRFHSSVPHTTRIAFEDTILPLSRPITTTSGQVISQLPIKGGQTIYVGISSYNRNSQIWGTDANIFDPFRWLDNRYNVENLPGMGPYSNLFIWWRSSLMSWSQHIYEYKS